MKKITLCILCSLLLLGCGGEREPIRSATPSTAPVVIETPQAETQGDATETQGVSVETPDDVGTLSILFINVGYGDAALIVYNGRAALIDTGEKAAAPQVFAALHHMGVSSLDAVALTHTHSDHIGGMEAVGRSLPVGRVYAATISENKKNGENKITELCDKLALPLTRLDAGDTVPLVEGLSFDVLGPLRYNAEDDNDNSLVLRLSFGGRTLLFTGDMQFSEEATLLDAGVALDADILKVGNHGNPDATSDEFGAAVSPQLAVISTSTKEDGDSANPRVKKALSGADVHVTQDYPLGVLVRVAADGSVSVSSPEAAASGAQLSAALSIGAQLLTLTNIGETEADLSGFTVLSERGGECFRFPEGSLIMAGESLTLTATGGGGDYAFVSEEKPWNVKKGDTALVYDAGGHLLISAAG